MYHFQITLTGPVLLKQFERDFNMKRDLDGITKLNPDVRIDRLRRFLETIKSSKEAQEDFDNWKMGFSTDVIKVESTVLVPITIQFKNVMNPQLA